jgi:hypothetical protein
MFYDQLFSMSVKVRLIKHSMNTMDFNPNYMCHYIFRDPATKN